MNKQLIEPHGGQLTELLIKDGTRIEELKDRSYSMKSWAMNERQYFDIELLLNGGFSPLQGYMNREEYESVLDNMRLKDNSLWSIPIYLDVSERFAEKLSEGEDIVLRDSESFPLAILHIEDIWKPEKAIEADKVYGTDDPEHPGVNYLLNIDNPVYLGGKISGLHLPVHFDYNSYRYTPSELRHEFARRGWRRVLAYHTRKPMHRREVEVTNHAANEIGANLLINPIVGITAKGDIDYFTRVRCYEKVLERYPRGTALMALLPLAMRIAGPREAMLHAIIRKNYGCNYILIRKNHADNDNGKNKSFYKPEEAQHLVKDHEKELGITAVPEPDMIYVTEMAKYFPVEEVPKGFTAMDLSNEEIEYRMSRDLPMPEWYSYPDVIDELKNGHPPLSKRGFTVFFTGLSGAGKSTLAKGLLAKLMQDGRRPVTLLDGDIVRTHLSSKLGFSREDRSINVRRIGFVASEITKNGGIAICAPIAPYESDRNFNRDLISQYGGYIEVYVNTPLGVCEDRDIKGLYSKARKGLIKAFTGIDDPYEPPKDPEITVNATNVEPEVLVQEVILRIKQLGYL